MTQPVLNRSQTIQAAALWEAVAAQATQEAAKLRADLEADARAEYAENGAAPTWRIPDLARVSLSISKEKVYVRDLWAFLKWVKQNHPDAVETVEQIKATWREGFLKRAVETDLSAPEDRQCLDAATGEVIPGLGVSRGGVPIGISITVESDAKKAFAAVAEVALQRLAIEAGPAVPIVLAEAGE